MKLAKNPFSWCKVSSAEPPIFLSLFREILIIQKMFLGSNQTSFCQVKAAALAQDYTFCRKFIM